MILKDTILSTVTDRITLLRWLKQVEKALQADTLEDISLTQISDTEVKIRLTFADKQFVESPVLTMPRGPQGVKGDTGATGPQGIAATVEVGTTTTGEAGTPAAVVNAGDETHAVLNFTIPRGEKGDKGDKGEGADVLILDFVNGTTTITAAEFEKFRNPALVIWGHYVDPQETDTGKVALRMAKDNFNNDTSEEKYYFAPVAAAEIKTRLTAIYDGSTYSYTITDGYYPIGFVVHFTINGSPKTASNEPYDWQTWVNSPEGAGWYIRSNSDGAPVITDLNEQPATRWITEADNRSDPVNPNDVIINGHEYNIFLG